METGNRLMTKVALYKKLLDEEKSKVKKKVVEKQGVPEGKQEKK